MRLLVCGGRDFSDGKLLWDWLELIRTTSPTGITTIIEGGNGWGNRFKRPLVSVDTMARLYGGHMGIPVETYNADWVSYPRAAGPIRNAQMLREGRPDCVVGFPTGGSGTEDMLAKALRAKLRVIRVTGMFAEGFKPL